MLKVTFISIVLAITVALPAQDTRIRVSIGAEVDTTDVEISAAIKVWEAYLNSNPDSVYANPYWSESEQRQYKSFDLVNNTWFSPSLYFYLRLNRPTVHARSPKVLGVTKNDGSLILKTEWSFERKTKEEKDTVMIFAVTEVAAHKENGNYKLGNAFPYNTRSWSKERVGSITYIFPLEHQFNRDLAERMSQFIDSLATVWNLERIPVEYYFADDINRVYRALGIVHWPGENIKRTQGGFADSKNQIIYAAGADEWYPHEFVHIYINPLFPTAHPLFLEGYATYVGGSGGQALGWHIRRNHEYLRDRPEVEVLKFKGVDPSTGPDYYIGGLLCKMAEEKGGLKLLKKLMTYGPDDEGIYHAIRGIFGVPKEEVNSFLRAKLAEYATKK